MILLPPLPYRKIEVPLNLEYLISCILFCPTEGEVGGLLNFPLGGSTPSPLTQIACEQATKWGIGRRDKLVSRASRA